MLSAELALTASDLGLLAGGYFLGFALTQLPLGTWLDRHGPRRVILAFPVCRGAGLRRVCVGQQLHRPAGRARAHRHGRERLPDGAAHRLPALAAAGQLQLRANSWMLMTGSLGMVAATLPVQWLLPVLGWRGLFWALAVLIALSMLGLACSGAGLVAQPRPLTTANPPVGYGQICAPPVLSARWLPIGFVNYGGMVAVQTLWAGPWMVKVAGTTPQQAAQGLFGINLCMLCSPSGSGVWSTRTWRAGAGAPSA